MAASIKVLRSITSVTPVTLFRLQAGELVRLRVKDAVLARGRTEYDIATLSYLLSGLDVVVDPPSDRDVQPRGPNGMPVHSKGVGLAVAVANVFEIPAGTKVPWKLCVVHEPSDLYPYSIQPGDRMTPRELNWELTNFLAQPGVVRTEGRDAFYARHPDMHPMVVGFSRNG